MGAIQLPQDAVFYGVPVYPLLLFILIGIAYLFTLLGGQIAVIVTDFIQGMFVNILMIVIIIVVVCSVGIPVISDTLMNAMGAKDRLLMQQAVEAGFVPGEAAPNMDRAMAVLTADEQNPKLPVLTESLQAGMKSGRDADSALAGAQAHYRSRDSMINPFSPTSAH